MPRIRTIKPEFWTDDKIVELSFPARLLFIGLWNFCDDWGRMEYNPKSIKLKIFPGDDVDTEELLGELERLGLIRPYEVDGKRYFVIPNFRKHQNKVSLKSKPLHPAPPWETGKAKERDPEPPGSPSGGGTKKSPSGTFKNVLEDSRTFKKALEDPSQSGKNPPPPSRLWKNSPLSRPDPVPPGSPSRGGTKKSPSNERESGTSLRVQVGPNILEDSRKFYSEKEKEKEQVNINHLSISKRTSLRVQVGQAIEIKNKNESKIENSSEIFSEFEKVFGLNTSRLIDQYGEEKVLKAADKMLYMHEKGREILDARAYFEKVVINPGTFPDYWERKKIREAERKAKERERLDNLYRKLLNERVKKRLANMTDEERERIMKKAEKERIERYLGQITIETVFNLVIKGEEKEKLLVEHPEFIALLSDDEINNLSPALKNSLKERLAGRQIHPRHTKRNMEFNMDLIHISACLPTRQFAVK